MDRQNRRTNGKSKAIQIKSHKEAYLYTLTKREKGKKYIYIIAPKVHCLNFGMILCLFRYSRDAGYIKVIVEIYSTAPEAAGRDFAFSSLFPQLLGLSFGLDPPLRVGRRRASVPRPDRTGLK